MPIVEITEVEPDLMPLSLSAPPFGAAYKGATLQLLEHAKEAAGLTYKPSVFNPGTLISKGPIRIARNRVLPSHLHDEPGFNMYYELHGTGPNRIAFIMGLSNSCASWLDQVEEFGSDPACSVLVLDNRGYGNTDAPMQRYTTSDMALDVLEVMDHVGWKEDRSVNLIGVSMGGMIALELARQEPSRLASLMLLSTTAGEGGNLPPLSGLMAITKGIGESVVGIVRVEARVSRVVDVLFPKHWQKQKHPMDPAGRTNGEVMRDIFRWRHYFTLNPSFHGPMSQMVACLTHHVPEKALKAIQDNVPKVSVVTGDWDNLVAERHSHYMSRVMEKAQFREWHGAGHAIHLQFPEKFNAYVREFLDLTPTHS
ncbi:hypothetical protein MEQU1_002492 [Malassezia equina]|uniref:AB hydrolase-1 domain-containing protein n=1 Tax=Malassezia equina TaxID=1381935 RepID=A0AAF0J0T1_9BASI|nr:hypothetical protein MEQU1_002492 [Malassezia equina]